MPKIGKEKFSVNGLHHKGRTTFKKDIEMYLHYNTENHYFYFDRDELKNYFKEPFIDFRKCDTRAKAIGMIVALLDELTVKTRMLRIELRMPNHLYSVPNPKHNPEDIYTSQDRLIKDEKLPKYLHQMLDDIHGARSGLCIGFSRIMKLENGAGVAYADCNDKWECRLDRANGYERNLIEWTEEREKFLLSIQEQMDVMSKKVLDYFTADNIDALYSRMENTKKLIG